MIILESPRLPESVEDNGVPASAGVSQQRGKGSGGRGSFRAEVVSWLRSVARFEDAHWRFVYERTATACTPPHIMDRIREGERCVKDFTKRRRPDATRTLGQDDGKTNGIVWMFLFGCAGLVICPSLSRRRRCPMASARGGCSASGLPLAGDYRQQSRRFRCKIVTAKTMRGTPARPIDFSVSGAHWESRSFSSCRRKERKTECTDARFCKRRCAGEYTWQAWFRGKREHRALWCSQRELQTRLG